MNSLSDLRATLDTHAQRVSDDEATARTTAVRHRIGVVRRRRQAWGAGALALVLIAVGAATVVRRGGNEPAPSSPTVFGVTAPVTIMALDRYYGSDGTSETFDGHGSVSIASSSLPRLFSWTTDQPATVRLQLPDGEYWTSTRSGFRDFVLVPPGTGGELQVSTSAGQVGLAAYHLTDRRPPDAMDGDPSSFRAEVAGARVIGGMQLQTRRLKSWSRYFGHHQGTANVAVRCTGAPAGSHVHVVVRGRERSSACDGLATFDPGAGNVIGSVPLGSSGRNGRFRAWISGPGSSRPLEVAKPRTVMMGAYLYAPVDWARVSGARMDRTIEYGGHTWRLARTRESSGASIRVQIRAHHPALVRVGARYSPSSAPRLRLLASGMPPVALDFPGAGGGTSAPAWAPAGASVRVTRSAPGQFGVGIYTLADTGGAG